MVDCRPGAGAPPHELGHTQPNGGAPNDQHHNQAGGSGDMGAHGMASPAPVRSSTPAATNTLATYTNAMNPLPGGMAGTYVSGGYAGVGKVMWCGGGGAVPHHPPPHPAHHLPAPPPPPPPPHGVNPHVYKSVQANGADLPMNDIPTLRYYFNLGVECMWAAYGPPPQHLPPRHYSPRDLAQDMQQISIHDRPVMAHGADQNKHKPGQPNDKPQLNNQGKGNGQRPLLGPRFKRGGNNQDGSQNSNHNQNKHNNNMGNKGPNNRRNSHTDGRNSAPHMGYNSGGGEGECVIEQPLVTLPYIPYPPPMYPIQYYPVEADPAMMGMMGGMGYVTYEEGMEFGVQPYYPPHPPHYPPPHPPPPPHHIEHK